MMNPVKIPIWIAFIWMAVILPSCDMSLSEIIDGYGPNSGIVLKDTTLTINTANQDVTVSFDKIHVEISQGTIMNAAQLTIKEYDPAEEVPVEDFDCGPVYDVTIEGHDQFDPTLKITLDFDNEQVAEKLESGIFPMFYNDSLQQWERFKLYSVDTAANQVEIVTSHLCKLSWWSPNRYLGYTDLFSNGAYNIYWKSGDIPSNATFNSPNASLYTYSKNPHYIEDLAHFLLQIWDIFQI